MTDYDINEQSEQRQRARKAEDKAAFRSAVGLIIGDLLIAMEVKEYGWSYHGLSPAAFDDQPVGYKTFKPIVETMEAVGLIAISKGRNIKAPQFNEGVSSYYPGFASRFRPTQVMVSMADERGVRHERRVPDAPRPNEILVVLALGIGGRPLKRINPY
jgi:hypothetical protein